MQLVCPHCRQQLEFTGPRPKFCSNCGQLLAERTPSAVTTDEAATLPPKHIVEADTLPPPAPVASVPGDEPQTVGPYRLIRRLGGGGMGTVYEAVDEQSGQRVALKLVQTEYATSKQALERFRQEGELASKLTHPRCVFVLASDEHQGRPYIVMELMTGSTLEDLVKQQGPLPPEQALRKILDVIEGLHEAHQLGLVHRDVKPSNCFLEANGRVKIGDFGLAKSLLREAHLTRTGTFMGTPLFAAPEQIKLEHVDAQSDVYSVAATFYYLLTGQAPFQTGDPMASMARIVADDPPSLRTLRPQLPKALDKVVLRGLERDRNRRWRSLDDFRRALMLFLPAEPSVGGVWFRLIAFIIDQVIIGLPQEGINLGLYAVFPVGFVILVMMKHLVIATFNLAYFGVMEGIWGWSLGKRLVRLRVGSLAGNQPPGIGRALLRAAILYGCLGIGSIIGEFIVVGYFPESIQGLQEGQSLQQDPNNRTLRIIATAANFSFYLGVALLVCTMRKRNGYRGLHEFLSGTRTYRLRWPEIRKRRPLEAPEFHVDVMQPAGLPEHVGPYRVRGALHSTPLEQMLLGENVQLGRAVWLWLRPTTEQPVGSVRRAVDRTTRVRWVSGGAEGDQQWDAFIVPSGCPLSALMADGRRLSWPQFRGILEDLTEEIRASCAEGTLPQSLTSDHVWVDPSGRVQLIERPLGSTMTDNALETTMSTSDQERALAFLGEVALLALEGRPRPVLSPPPYIQAPLPLHAASLLNRLILRPAGTAKVRSTDLQRPYCTVDEFKADLLATLSEPAEVTRWMRAKQLVGHGIFAGLGLMANSLLLYLLFTAAIGVSVRQAYGNAMPGITALTLSLFIFFLPAYLTRGGLSFLRAGIAVVGATGRRASGLRCLWRALVSWAFVAAVAALAGVGIEIIPEARWVELGITGVGIAIFAGYMGLTLRNPARAPHDFLAGTYLVPK
jgi:hypothetical protein